MVSWLEALFTALSQIVTFFKFLFSFVFSAVSFLWTGAKFLFSLGGILPAWVAAPFALAISLAVLLLIFGR